MCLSDFSNKELVLLASSLAIAFSKEFNNDELLTLAAFFTAFADNLSLFSL